MITFGVVKGFSGARIQLDIVGANDDARIEALYMQPGSAAGASVWLPPATGDIVVVSYDPERPEDSVVLGCVYPDGKTPPKSGKDEIALRADKVYIGSDVAQTKPCTRDDHIQAELSKLKSELDKISSIFNAHTHVCSAPGEASAIPVVPYTNAYSVGATASDSVEVE
jgi:hypothetical protein